MTYLNDGDVPDDNEEYASVRPLIYQHLNQIKDHMLDTVGHDFYRSLELGIFGRFVFLKRYKQGYVFHHIDTGIFYQAVCLTMPLDEMVEEYSVIETALIPYANRMVCDGLVLSAGVFIGKNMAKELRGDYWAAKRSGELVVCA